MRSVIVAFLLTVCLLCTAYASSRSVTFYADGARVELSAEATKGVIEIPLPAEMIENSLRIKPLGNVVLKQVDLFAPKAGDGKRDKEQERLVDQKNRLLDRLKALETREEIFTAAAKSQSGKAPRKSKTNPEPLQSIRQGTDFAIAQLEDVYSTRRKTEQELKRIDALIANAGKRGVHSGTVVRILLGSMKGSVSVCYQLKDNGWIPRYDLRIIDADTAVLEMAALLPKGFGGYKRYASVSKNMEGDIARAVVPNVDVVLLAQYRMPVSELFFGNDGVSGFSFTIKNSGNQYLPAGEVTVYRSGEYMGKAKFDRLSSGGSQKITQRNN